MAKAGYRLPSIKSILHGSGKSKLLHSLYHEMAANSICGAGMLAFVHAIFIHAAVPTYTRLPGIAVGGYIYLQGCGGGMRMMLIGINGKAVRGLRAGGSSREPGQKLPWLAVL